MGAKNSNCYFCHSFGSISTKLHATGKYDNHGGV